MNNWKTFKDFINANGEAGATFSRSGLRRALPDISKGTIDGYRSMLQKAGFFEACGRGAYRLLTKIPTDITWQECSLLEQHKNLDYLESVHNRQLKQEKRAKKNVN